MKSHVIYLTQNILAPSQAVATARIMLKICQGQPPTFGSQVPNFIQSGSLSAEL